MANQITETETYRKDHKDRLQLKILQKDLDKEIQQCKQNYKCKLEANFSEGNSRQAWKGLQAITGYKTKPRSFSNISSADAKELCDNLNTFYARFDSKDNYSTLIDELETVCDNDNPIDISEHEVRLLFKELNSRKSPGPDNISPLLLKVLSSCHNELSGVYQHLFQLSISSGIPRIWKTAVIVPVPKKTTAKEYNDYRQIALTSVPFILLKLKFSQYSSIHTNYIIPHCTTLQYNHNI